MAKERPNKRAAAKLRRIGLQLQRQLKAFNEVRDTLRGWDGPAHAVYDALFTASTKMQRLSDRVNAFASFDAEDAEMTRASRERLDEIGGSGRAI